MRFEIFKLLRCRGSSSIMMSLISIGLMSSIALGVSKMHEINYHSIRATHDKMQAEQYAQDRAAILRSMDFSTISELPKQVVAGTASAGVDNIYYEEVVEDSSDSVYKEYKINIYKGNDVKPIASLVMRKTNPGFLIDGQLVGSGVSATDKALNSRASREYSETRFADGIDSDSETNAMSANALKMYVSNILQEYVKSANAVKYTPGTKVGSATQAVYIASDGYVKAGNVNTRMFANSTSGKIAVLVQEDGIYYIDYLKKSNFFTY